MNRLEKIERDAQKARDKIAAMQSLLKQIEGQRTEQENLQIVQHIRALKLSRDELYTFLGGGNLPASLLDSIGNTNAAEPETIHSRRGRAATPQRTGATPEGEPEQTENESEGGNNEE